MKAQLVSLNTWLSVCGRLEILSEIVSGNGSLAGNDWKEELRLLVLFFCTLLQYWEAQTSEAAGWCGGCVRNQLQLCKESE